MRTILLSIVFFFPLLVLSQRTAHLINGPRGNKVGFYQFLPPDYSSGATHKHPLIIFLHGIGEKGTGREPDLQRLNCCGIPKYISGGHTMQFSWLGRKESFVVLYPQLSSKYGTWQTYYVDVLIRYAKEHLNIDSNRIFLTGLSLGGGGTWVYASASLQNASKLAGIVPVVSPCFMTNGCNIANANLPVLTVHAMDDVMASPACTINAIRSVVDCGAAATPNLIMYPTGGHYIWVRRAYDTAYNFFNPNVFEWMLAQDKRLPPNKKPVAAVGPNLRIPSARGFARLDATASFDPDGKIVRFVWEKVSGPTCGIMSADVTPTPFVSGLTMPGVYTFRVRVIDNRAEWSTADVKITVVDGGVLN